MTCDRRRCSRPSNYKDMRTGRERCSRHWPLHPMAWLLRGLR